jgi:hypothetical protein
MSRPSAALAVSLLLTLLVPLDGFAGQASLRIRSSAVASPCVEAVGRAWEARGGRALDVETGALRDAGDWDVLVGSGVELTRALEGGDAVIDSDVGIADIPWVLHLTSGGDVRSLSDVVQSGVEITMLAGPAAYEARRALARDGTVSVRETTDGAELRSAPVALVPLSLAGSGRQVEVDVPPVRVDAAVGMRARHGDDAQAFVRYLGSEAGRQVFATCSPQ